MKIAFFTENYHCGGLDTFLINLINYWPNLDDELIVVCNKSHPGFDTLRQKITRPCHVMQHDMTTYPDLVNRCSQFLLLSVLRKAASYFLRYAYIAKYFLQLPFLFKNLNPDFLMVVNGGHPGGDSCRAAVIAWGVFAKDKPKAIYNFHNLAAKSRWLETIPEFILDKLIIKFSKNLIGVSRVCAESLNGRLAMANCIQAEWIYNGIADTPSIAPSLDLRAELGLNPQAKLCVMLATYEPRKGHAFLFEAFSLVLEHIPDVYLLVCGYGNDDEKHRVKALLAQYQLENHVFLQGFRQDVQQILADVDLLVVPSQAFESFGLVIVEAMAQKTPVVATNVGGIPEVLINDEGGYCVPYDSSQQFADAIIVLLSDAVLHNTQGEKGYTRFSKQFAAPRMSQAYKNLLIIKHLSEDEYQH